MLYAIISPLYLLCILHSLIARVAIRRILEEELQLQHVSLLARTDTPSLDNRKMHVLGFSEAIGGLGDSPDTNKVWELESEGGKSGK